MFRQSTPGLKNFKAITGAALSVAGGLGLFTAANADAPAPAPNYNIQTSGVIVGYYQFQFQNPKGNVFLPQRAFDIRDNAPTLNLAELNIFKTPKPAGFGWKATLIAGDDADIIHGQLGTGGPTGAPVDTEARLKNILQLYGTYAFAGAGGGIDVGKFVTPFGYELIEENANYNFSNSLPFNLLPFYNAGIRAYTPSMKGLTATGYLVQSLYNTPSAGVHDDNGTPAFIGQVNYAAPSGKYTVIESLGGGKDKFGGINNKILLSDANLIFNLNASTTLGLDYVYATFEPDGGSKTTANGYAGYYKMQLNPKNAVAVRISGNSVKTSGISGTAQPYEATATYEIKTAANMTTRLEYRHDHANAASGVLFPDKNGASTKSDQDTATIGEMFTF